MPTNPELSVGQNVYGLLNIGGVEVALPLSALREVVPCPATFEKMPAKADGFLGAMELRGCIVPVLDIRSTINADPNNGEHQIVVVMTNGTHIIGLLADELRSIQRIDDQELIAATTRNGELIFETSFLHPDTQAIVSVISLDALLDTPGIPLLADVTSQTKPESVQLVTGGPSKKYTLVAAGAHVFAFNIDQIHTTIPDCTTSNSILKSSLCRGVAEFDGNDVPVLDPLALFGLGVMPQELSGPGLVIKVNDGYVILALSALLELREVSDAAITALPPFAVRRPEMFLGMSETPSGLCLFFDGEALMSEPEILSHAAVNTKHDESEEIKTSDETALNSKLGGEAQLTFSIGFEVATPLAQIQEILPVSELTTDTQADAYVIGVMAHREKVIPVLCLRTMLGLDPIAIDDQSCLLLVGHDADQVALAVDGLKAIDTIAWRDPATGATPITSAGEFGEVVQRAPLVQVSEQSRLIPQLDLAHIVELLTQPTLDDLDSAIAGLSSTESNEVVEV